MTVIIIRATNKDIFPHTFEKCVIIFSVGVSATSNTK